MSKKTADIIIALLAVAILPLLLSCTGAGNGELPEGGDTLTRHSSLLTMIDHGNGITSARVADPWNNGKILATYLLVNRDVADKDIPQIKDAVVIRVPVQSAVVYSGVHSGAIEELGATNRITGVADAAYFTSATIRNRLASGRIRDVGNSMSPSLDRIVDLDPDVVILSPYENSGHGILEKTGIAVVDMADYMEPSPLARAEWILFIGALVGQRDKAADIYNNVCAQYNRLAQVNSGLTSRPVVLSEMPFNGVWYQPGGHSYMARMTRDAGARPLLDSDHSTGSVQLDIASVYDRAVNADIWLMKNASAVKRADILSATGLAADIRAFKTGNTWNVNTLISPYYDDIAFHPERILRDMVVIVNPAAADSLGTPRYFARVR